MSEQSKSVMVDVEVACSVCGECDTLRAELSGIGKLICNYQTPFGVRGYAPEGWVIAHDDLGNQFVVCGGCGVGSGAALARRERARAAYREAFLARVEPKVDA